MILEELKKHNSIYLLVNEKFCVSIIDRNGVLLHVNENFCKLSKYQADELLGQEYGIVNPVYDRVSFLEELERNLEHHHYWHKKIRSVAKDGAVYWVDATIAPIRSDDGSVSGFISIDSDITASEITTLNYTETLNDLQNVKNALDHSSVVAITDSKGVITYVNEKFCELSQYTPAELIGNTHRVINSGYHDNAFFKEMWETIQNGAIWQGDIRNRAKDGSFYWVATTVVPFLKENGKPVQFISIRHDITTRKEAEHSLEIALRNDFRQTVKNLQNGIFKFRSGEGGRVLYTLIEGKIVEKLGLTVELMNRKLYKTDYTEKQWSLLSAKCQEALTGSTVQFELHYASRTFLVYLSPIFENGTVLEVVGTATDISDRIKAEKAIERMAYYDTLTGLANRVLLKETLAEWMEQNNARFALLFMDLDRFKSINDSLGHQFGDSLLEAVASRLSSSIGKHDFAARLGGDEFVVLLQSADRQQVETAARKIVEDLSEPYIINQHEIFITPSIGITLFPEDGSDYSTLLRNADSAMYVAKESGKGTFEFFTKQLQDEMVEQTMIEMEMRHAIQRRQLSLVYQPQYDLAGGGMKGMEALLRWHHPIHGYISPAYLIPIAEDTGLIMQIGEWVLRTACQQAKEWQDEGLLPVRVSVNVSIRQFHRPTFVQEVRDILEQTGLKAEYLNLEITESMMADVLHCKPVLEELRELGVHVSVDDFGTGYSSLLYLSKYPLTHLKIDQAFIKDLNASNTMIVKAIIDLAKNLQLDVVAEGVETAEQAEFLKQLECDEAQGYLYSRPLPKDEFAQLLRSEQTLLEIK